jgi:hypothetical protein
VNVGDIASTGGNAFGIVGQTFSGLSPLSIVNNGDFQVTAARSAFGIVGRTFSAEPFEETPQMTCARVRCLAHFLMRYRFAT